MIEQLRETADRSFSGSRFIMIVGLAVITAYSVAGVAAWHRSLPTTADSVVIAEATGVTFVQFNMAVLALGLLAGSRAPVVTECRATGFDIVGDELAGVRTNRGTVATRRCVIAAGPLSGIIATTAGITLPIRTLRRHRLLLRWTPSPHVAP